MDNFSLKSNLTGLMITDGEIAMAEVMIKSVGEKQCTTAATPFDGAGVHELEKSLAECIAFRTATIVIMKLWSDGIEEDQAVKDLAIEMKLAKVNFDRGLKTFS